MLRDYVTVVDAVTAILVCDTQTARTEPRERSGGLGAPVSVMNAGGREDPDVKCASPLLFG